MGQGLHVQKQVVYLQAMGYGIKDIALFVFDPVGHLVLWIVLSKKMGRTADCPTHELFYKKNSHLQAANGST